MTASLLTPTVAETEGGPDRGTDGAVSLVELILPEHINHHGTLFGGRAAELMVRAAFVAATRAVRRSLVIAGSRDVRFTSPVHPGELLEISSCIRRIGRTSVTVDLVGHAEDLVAGRRRPAMSGRFTLVAVDDQGRPAPIGSTTGYAPSAGGSSVPVQ
ncbi:acyl-CoA thioesterase [Nakamurella leprariae]|uniref:Acyl-CoA thioesterase n=1 Tax=Nakamurella leprariae TaxID=2803911 RepID=A0A938YF09_9ACTN|nr:acyl-CoA thioesterase [Nakamurella leprariae]MBM9466578.1 acyl-CoA thioesterase [Nakamurella leprariae]